MPLESFHLGEWSQSPSVLAAEVPVRLLRGLFTRKLEAEASMENLVRQLDEGGRDRRPVAAKPSHRAGGAAPPTLHSTRRIGRIALAHRGLAEGPSADSLHHRSRRPDEEAHDRTRAVAAGEQTEKRMEFVALKSVGLDAAAIAALRRQGFVSREPRLTMRPCGRGAALLRQVTTQAPPGREVDASDCEVWRRFSGTRRCRCPR